VVLCLAAIGEKSGCLANRNQATPSGIPKLTPVQKSVVVDAHAHAQGQDELKDISEVLTIGVAHERKRKQCTVSYNIPTKQKRERGRGG